MKKTFFPAALMIALNAIILAGCYTDNEEDLYPSTNCDLTSVTYSLTVKPIMLASCALSGCHDAATASNGVNLIDYAGAKAVADNGKLLGTINHSSGFSAMPKNTAKLSQCNLDKIKKWVDAGAPNN